MPRTSSRVLPKRSTAWPPALVDRLPPIVQLPSAASDSGNMRPSSAAACWTAASGTPASTVSVAFAASTARTRFIRDEREDDRVAAVVRRRAAALAGVAALRHDRNAEVGAGAHDRGDLLGAARAHDRERAPVIAAAPVGDVGCDVGRIGQDLLASDGRVEPRPQGCANVHHDRR